MTLAFFSKIGITLVALYVAHRIYREVTVGQQRRAFIKQHGCLPAKRDFAKDPIFNLDAIITSLNAFKEHRLLEWRSKRFADAGAHTITLRPLRQHVFYTDEPENVKAMLATNFNAWSIGKDRIAQMSSYLGSGIFTTDGAAWRHSRDILRPCFERSQVADVSIMEKHTNRMMELAPTDGSTVDLQPLFHDLTLDVATEFLFGKSTNSLDKSGEEKDVGVDEFVEAFEYCQNPFHGLSKWGILGLFLPDPKFKTCAKTVQAFADNIIKPELSTKPTNPDPTRYIFLHTLLSQTHDPTTLRSELLNILLAGRDTTASLLSNLVWELSRQPTVLAIIRHEIAQHLGPAIAAVPTYQQLKGMKYLRAVINETQRLYPIVPTNSREALHDTMLPCGGGPDGQAPVFVPKGAVVVYHIYSMHRRADIFGADAETFTPERWLDDGNEDGEKKPLRPGWGYIPFSGGPRVCIGQNFAITETMFVVVRLLQRFEVVQRDEEAWREKISVTCTGLNGCKVGLRLRRQE